MGESVIRRPSPLNVLKDTHDHSCYLTCSDEHQHLMTVSLPPAAGKAPLSALQKLEQKVLESDEILEEEVRLMGTRSYLTHGNSA